MRGKTRLSVAACASAALLLAACSSSGGSGGATTSAPAGGAGSNAGTNYSAMLTQAREMVPATFQGPTTPAKAPANIKIAAITCYSILEGCVIPAEGIAKAASAIGWQSRTFDGGGTPTQPGSTA